MSSFHWLSMPQISLYFGLSPCLMITFYRPKGASEQTCFIVLTTNDQVSFFLSSGNHSDDSHFFGISLIWVTHADRSSCCFPVWHLSTILDSASNPYQFFRSWPAILHFTKHRFAMVSLFLVKNQLTWWFKLWWVVIWALYAEKQVADSELTLINSFLSILLIFLRV